MSELVKLKQLATRLRELQRFSPTTNDGLEAWYAEAHRFSEELRSNYSGVGVPAQVWHYLHDADIRVKEPEYRLAQDDMLTDIIVSLERGEVPESAGVNFAFHPRWLGVLALLVAAIIYWAFR